jgi:hypothetical protein
MIWLKSISYDSLGAIKTIEMYTQFSMEICNSLYWNPMKDKQLLCIKTDSENSSTTNMLFN